MSERLACCNPRCKRTASTEKHPGCNEIICGKCWKLLPKKLTARYRQLRKRDRKGCRLAERKDRAGKLTDKQIEECDRLATNLMNTNWLSIRNFFRDGDMPEDLNQFLKDGFLVETTGR